MVQILGANSLLSWQFQSLRQTVDDVSIDSLSSHYAQRAASAGAISDPLEAVVGRSFIYYSPKPQEWIHGKRGVECFVWVFNCLLDIGQDLFAKHHYNVIILLID